MGSKTPTGTVNNRRTSKRKIKVSWLCVDIVELVLEQVVSETLHFKFDENDDSHRRKRRCTCYCIDGMFNWFKVLWNLTDEKLLQLNGADYTLYLVFLRYTANFFAILTLFNIIFMIPMFVSGEPDPKALENL